MGWFNKLFGKKEEVKTEEVKQVEKPKEEWIQSPVPKDQWVCEGCKGTIDCGERYSKLGGKWYHKQCAKAIKRMVFN